MVPVRSVVAKLPSNDVAVTTPTALIPPANTSIPVLAVMRPTESTLDTSSYVRVPPILTLLENSAEDAVITFTEMLGFPLSPAAVPVISSLAVIKPAPFVS